jgi:hypothetical protein
MRFSDVDQSHFAGIFKKKVVCYFTREMSASLTKTATKIAHLSPVRTAGSVRNRHACGRRTGELKDSNTRKLQIR